MRDTYGREINCARISVTDLCNLRCVYCMPQDGVKKKPHSDILRLEEIILIARALAHIGIDKIRLTGGEPLLRKGFLRIVEEIGKISSIRDFAMTTNGILLPQYAAKMKELGLNRVNISLDTLNEKKFRQITVNGNLDDALKGIKVALECGFKVKTNTVLINGFNTDEIEAIARLTVDNDIDVRFIELMAIGTQSAWTQNKYANAEIVLDTLSNHLEEIDLREDKSSPAVYYKLRGAKGRIGLIRPISKNFCGQCNRIRVTADGKIKICLHSDLEIDIRDKLGDESQLQQAIINAINKKPYEHELNNGKVASRGMSRIGG